MTRTPRALWGLLCLLTVVAAPAPLLAQNAQESPRFAVSVAAGMTRPAQAAVRDVYGSRFAPVTVALDCRLTHRLFVFGGWQFLRQQGDTIIVGPRVIDERYPVRLTMSSARAGAGVAVPWRKWIFSAAAGLTYVTYDEQWTTADLSANGHSYGYLAQGAGEILLHRRFGIVGRIEYVAVPIPKATAGRTGRDLGGLSVSGGAAVRF
jgi:hypothetical protein